MDNALNYDPLDYYKDVLAERHSENVREYFDALTEKSGINVEENRKTVREYNQISKEIEALGKRLFGLKFLRVFLYVVAALAILLSFGVIHYIVGISIAAVSLILIFLLINSKIKGYKELYSSQSEKKEALYRLALSQMSALNALFTKEATLKLFEKTNPAFRFEKGYREEMSLDMRLNFDMPDYDNEESSVLDTLAGYYNKNPFVYLRRLVHTMGTEIYHGYRTISWTESYRDSKGNVRTRVRTQQLHAQLTKPKPYYTVDTVLHFGASSAPNLSFTRRGEHINEKSDAAIDKLVKKREKRIAKRSQKAISRGDSFVSMTNTQFDVLFNATDRDNEVEFRLMFTPLAQTSMVELILSDDTYGDDFDFYKMRRHNVIRSYHAQRWDMDTQPEIYFSHSYDEAKKKFENYNNEYFKSVYFDFAPLLAVPAYQEENRAMKTDLATATQAYSNEEYEAMANALGAKNFAHEFTNSNIILKSSYLGHTKDGERIEVHARSYATESRADAVMVLGGDGRMHAVVVPWIEYIPVSRSSEMFIDKEENGQDEKADALSIIRNNILAYIKQ